ncbi:MAG: hypothetical protein GC205_02375 [Bacteroidetes bacterium]|nr:hypothetical protein [Bacteroidota bacterium]
MVIRDEGYVKFQQDRVEAAPLQEVLWQGLEAARDVLYRAGLVGMYADGIGFGNVSWLEPGFLAGVESGVGDGLLLRTTGSGQASGQGLGQASGQGLGHRSGQGSGHRSGQASTAESTQGADRAFVPFIISGTQTGNRAQLDGRYYVRVLSVHAPANALRCEGPIDASSESMTHAAVYAADPNIGCVLHVHHLEHWRRLLHQVPTTAAEVAYGTPAMAQEVSRLFLETELRKEGVFAMAGHEEGLVSFGATPKEALERLRAWGVLPVYAKSA